MSWNTWTWSWYFSSVLGLLWQSALKNVKVKVDVLTDIDIFLMVKKVLKVEYIMVFIDMQNLTTKHERSC